MSLPLHRAIYWSPLSLQLRRFKRFSDHEADWWPWPSVAIRVAYFRRSWNLRRSSFHIREDPFFMFVKILFWHLYSTHLCRISCHTCEDAFHHSLWRIRSLIINSSVLIRIASEFLVIARASLTSDGLTTYLPALIDTPFIFSSLIRALAIFRRITCVWSAQWRRKSIKTHLWHDFCRTGIGCDSCRAVVHDQSGCPNLAWAFFVFSSLFLRDP